MILYVRYFKNLSKQFKFKINLYVCSILLYNASLCWIDAKNKLIQYQENKLCEYEKVKIKNEWDAVKYGAYYNSVERFFETIFWPINIISNIIPYVVLNLYSKNSKK